MPTFAASSITAGSQNLTSNRTWALIEINAIIIVGGHLIDTPNIYAAHRAGSRLIGVRNPLGSLQSPTRL
jgi:hypothetical protein